jgi:hypothetical protein
MADSISVPTMSPAGASSKNANQTWVIIVRPGVPGGAPKTSDVGEAASALVRVTMDSELSSVLAPVRTSAASRAFQEPRVCRLLNCKYFGALI